MLLFRQEINFDRFVRGLIVLVVCIALAYSLKYLSPVLIPFFIAWAVAWMLAPVVAFFQYRCLLRSRLAAVLLTLLSVGGIMGLILWLFIPPLIDGITQIKDATLVYLQNTERGSIWPSWMQHFVTQWLDTLKLEEMLKEGNLMTAVRNTLPHVWDMLLSTANIVLSLIGSAIALLYLFFLLLDYDKYAKGWLLFIPPRHRPFLQQLSIDLEHNMRGYFRGQSLVALSNCVMFCIGFWLIGLPMPIGMGIFVGAISFVPYIQVLGFFPAALLALLNMAKTGHPFWIMMLLILLVYIVVQVIQDTVFTPRIMGKIMGLSPAIVLLSLSVWGYMAGIVGLIVALPLTTIAINYYKRYIIDTNN